MNVTAKTQQNLKKLATVLDGAKSLLIVLQNNPDPDAIAAAMALRKLAHKLAGMSASIAHAGEVGRAENRALVHYLRLNLRSLPDLDVRQFDRIAMVDTQPGTGNNALPEGATPHIVIDHHPCRQETRRASFYDVRRAYGATATIMTEYLEAAKIRPDAKLATALLYGIRSDTQDLGSDSSRVDVEAIERLFPLANKRILSNIQRGQVTRGYWQMLADAIRNAQVFPGVIVTSLGRVENADMIAEVADLLLRDEETQWTLAYGLSDSTLLLSLRTSYEGAHAHRVIRRIVAGRGTGGGRDYRAGGQIPLKRTSPSRLRQLEDSIRRRLLLALELQETQGKPLVPTNMDAANTSRTKARRSRKASKRQDKALR